MNNSNHSGSTTIPPKNTNLAIDSQLLRSTTNFLKLYSSCPPSEKYSGAMTDVLELKLSIFEERCVTNDIMQDERQYCFSAMLMASSLYYYFTSIIRRNSAYAEMVESIRKRFIIAEIELALTRE